MTTLRVDYRCGLVRFSGTSASSTMATPEAKAVAWWIRMGGSAPIPSSVREAEDRAAAELRRPTLITVKRVGKYPEIVRHRFDVQEAA